MTPSLRKWAAKPRDPHDPAKEKNGSKFTFFFFLNVQKRQQAIKRKYASCKPFGYFVTLHFKKKHFSKKPTSAPVER